MEITVSGLEELWMGRPYFLGMLNPQVSGKLATLSELSQLFKGDKAKAQ